jgi:hypothetical protein
LSHGGERERRGPVARGEKTGGEDARGGAQRAAGVSLKLEWFDGRRVLIEHEEPEYRVRAWGVGSDASLYVRDTRMQKEKAGL